MKAILKISLNNIKKKKVQSILVLTIIMIAGIMIPCALNLMTSLDKPYAETHGKLNGFDKIIFINNRTEDADKVKGLFSKHENVEEIEETNGYFTSEYMKVNGEKMKQIFILQEKQNKDEGLDKLVILEGEESKCPKEGEVWLTKNVADNNNLKIGDICEFNISGQVITKKIGALVVDPVFGQAGFGTCRVWLGEGELEKIVPSQMINTILSMTFNNGEDGDNVLLDIENEMGRPIFGYSYNYSTVKSVSLMSFNMIGGVLLGIAVFILAFIVIVVSMTISNSIYSDYKNMGIFTTLGYTKRGLTLIYIIQFILMGFIASILGIIIGDIASVKLLESFYISLGFAKVEIPIVMTSIITIVSIFIFILIASLISTRKVLKLSAVEAIRQGIVPQREKRGNTISLTSLKNLNISLSLGIKSIFNNIRQSIIMFLIIGLSIYLITFCINVRYTFNNMESFSQYWGLDKCDISLKVTQNKVNKDILKDIEEIKKDSRIKDVTELVMYKSLVIQKTDKLPSASYPTLVFSNDLEESGLGIVEGEYAKGDDEIELSDAVSKIYSKEIGDYISIYINGQEKEFLITGKFQCIYASGRVFRFKDDVIKNFDPNFIDRIPNQVTVTVKDEKDIQNILQSLKEKHGQDYSIEANHQYLASSIKPNFGPMDAVIKMIMISFMVVALICIMNLNLINTYTNKKEIGIYKSLGFTNGQIILSYIYKIGCIVLGAILVFLPIEMITQDSVMSSIVASMGVDKLELTMRYAEAIITLGVFMLLLLATVIVGSRVISRINNRDLISE